MENIKTFESFNKNYNDNITLYHGTCENYSKMLLKHGWIPNIIKSGANQGNSKYLYLTSEIDDAKWFANENGCDTILEVSNIPIQYLIFDPEDGDADLYDYKIINAINKLNNGYKLPIKFALTKSLDQTHFKLLNSHK